MSPLLPKTKGFVEEGSRDNTKSWNERVSILLSLPLFSLVQIRPVLYCLFSSPLYVINGSGRVVRTSQQTRGAAVSPRFGYRK